MELPFQMDARQKAVVLQLKWRQTSQFQKRQGTAFALRQTACPHGAPCRRIPCQRHVQTRPRAIRRLVPFQQMFLTFVHAITSFIKGTKGTKGTKGKWLLLMSLLSLMSLLFFKRVPREIHHPHPVDGRDAMLFRSTDIAQIRADAGRVVVVRIAVAGHARQA